MTFHSPALDAETKSIFEGALTRFLDENYAPEVRHTRLKDAEINYREHWQTLAELGVLGLPVDVENGGIGGNAQDVADALRVLARGLLLEPLIESGIVAGAVLASHGEAPSGIEEFLSGAELPILVGGRRGDGLRVSREAGGWRLSGQVKVVPGAAQADWWLIAGTDADGVAHLLRVRPAESGAHAHAYRLMDGRSASDIHFDAVRVPETAAWLSGEAVERLLLEVSARAVNAYCADAAGAMACLVSMTGEYLKTREQFGATLASFQALQHRFADMHMAALEARAISGELARAIDANDTPRVQWLRFAAPSVVVRCAHKVGHDAIQLHGGMGVTDELVVSHYNSRLVVAGRLLEGWRSDPLKVKDVAPVADDDAAFRAEVREFVATQLAPATRHKVENGIYLEKHDYVDWQKALRRKGWFGATWPVHAGGEGWDVRREHAFLQECAINAAPMLIPYGVNMLGPVLYTFGTEEQKHRYLEGILNSDVWWCQGYSEPNAGSDLASLKTRAVRDGDHYVVNGTKMWTTEAHWADMMHCLVRTDSSGRKQQGISFLLIDMKTPGITVEPIVTIDGVHHTNQTFFDNVRVPVENLVGVEGDGWNMAKFLLARERTFIADTGNKIRMMGQIKATVAANAEQLEPAARIAQALRLAAIEADLTVLVALEHEYIEAWMSGHDDGVGASVLKVRGTEVLQSMTEFWRDAQGIHGACYDARLRASGDGLSAAEPWVRASAANYNYLYGRCWSIFGGTNEVQRNIIAATLLRG